MDWLAPLLFAPFAGSVLGVLVRRLPAGRPVVLARSACEACGRRLGWAEMIPLASLAVLGGRCRTCHARVAPMHWVIELAALGTALAVVLAHGPDTPAAVLWMDCLLGWTLLALGWIDWEHGILPDALTLPLVLLGLGATLWIEPAGVPGHAVGAAAGYAAFRLVALGYRAWRKRDGMGEGDAKLLAASGAWVGWQGLDQVVLLAALATIGLALSRGRGQRLSGQVSAPFGPGLALATFLVRLHG